MWLGETEENVANKTVTLWNPVENLTVLLGSQSAWNKPERQESATE